LEQFGLTLGIKWRRRYILGKQQIGCATKTSGEIIAAGALIFLFAFLVVIVTNPIGTISMFASINPIAVLAAACAAAIGLAWFIKTSKQEPKVSRKKW
jgi:hypothetical protein